MLKNKTAQLVFQTIYCTVGVIGVFDSLYFFDMAFFGKFYIYFTNWSNYLCLIIMFIELINTIKTTEECCVEPVYLLKFIGMISIVITFFCYNFPDPARNPAQNFTLKSIAFHIVLPIMYTIDWFLFYKKREIKLTYPIYATALPTIYVTFMFVRAWILNFDSKENNLYPYFFLNIENLGFTGAFSLCILFTLCYIIVGVVFIRLDKLIRSKECASVTCDPAKPLVGDKHENKL